MKEKFVGGVIIGLAVCIAMFQPAFAQSKACLDEKEKANAMKSNCMEVNKSKGTDDYSKCLEGLKAQVAKAKKICEAGEAPAPAPAPAKAPAPAPAKAPAPAPAKAPAPAPAKAIAKPEATEKGSFTDSRDNKTYKTVKIGEQTWMAENLNYAASGSKCYDNKPANCTKYGILYDRNEALKACPEGWHLPSDKEWQTLVDFAGSYEVAGKKLKAKSGWNSKGNGTDNYGFSALPGGNGNPPDYKVKFFGIGNYGSWWSSTEDKSSIGGSAQYHGMYADGDEMEGGGTNNSNMYSVRCVKDFEAPEPNAASTKLAAPSSTASKPEPVQELPTTAVAQEAVDPEPYEPPAEPSNNAPSPTTWRTFTGEPQDDDKEEDDDGPRPSGDDKGSKIAKDKKIRFGISLAYNGSIARYEEIDNRLGHGAELGMVANIPLAENFVLNTGMNAVYRTPFNYTYTENGYNYWYSETVKIYEYVLSAPVFLRYGFINNLIYAEAGFQADIPLKTESLITIATKDSYDEFYDECEWRASLDFSAALGFGWNINENFGIGIRGLYGLTEFDKEYGGVKLNQVSVGLTYLF